MNYVQKAQELSRRAYPLSTLNVGGKRYFYYERLQELGLQHLLSSNDIDLQIGGKVEDEQLLRDWAAFLDLLPTEHSAYYFMWQRHSDLSLAMEKEGRGECVGLGRRIDEADGLYTSRADFLLSSSFADCAPLLIFDPVAKVQANVHSGWRGTLADIGGKTLQSMQRDYALDMRNIYVFIGPHIGRDDFEVDADVALLFAEEYPELAGLIRKKSAEKSLIDLNLCLIYNFLRQGVPEDQILSVNRSTVAHPECFHSYRRDKENFGLMMVISQISL